MAERSPFGILTFDGFQGEYIDENISTTYATENDTKEDADHLLEELRLDTDSSDENPTYTLYIVGEDGERTFYKRG